MKLKIFPLNVIYLFGMAKKYLDFRLKLEIYHNMSLKEHSEENWGHRMYQTYRKRSASWGFE